MTTWMLRATWLGAGLAFAAFPLLRPWADETTLAGLLEVVRAVRFSPAAITLFGLGLLLLPVVGVLLVRAIWRLGVAVRVPALLLAVTLAAYLPQFYGPPSLRIAHGVLLGLACIALGVAAGRRLRSEVSAGGDQPVLQVAARPA